MILCSGPNFDSLLELKISGVSSNVNYPCDRLSLEQEVLKSVHVNAKLNLCGQNVFPGYFAACYL